MYIVNSITEFRVSTADCVLANTSGDVEGISYSVPKSNNPKTFPYDTHEVSGYTKINRKTRETKYVPYQFGILKTNVGKVTPPSASFYTDNNFIDFADLTAKGFFIVTQRPTI